MKNCSSSCSLVCLCVCVKAGKHTLNAHIVCLPMKVNRLKPITSLCSLSTLLPTSSSSSRFCHQGTSHQFNSLFRWFVRSFAHSRCCCCFCSHNLTFLMQANFSAFTLLTQKKSCKFASSFFFFLFLLLEFAS